MDQNTRQDALRVLAQIGPRLTDDVIRVEIWTDGLTVHTATREHAAELAQILDLTTYDTHDYVYVGPLDREYDCVRHSWSSASGKVAVFWLHQTPRTLTLVPA